MKKFLTNNSHQTFKLGEDFGKNLKSGDVVLLIGDLGTGKTTFVQGIAKGLGIRDRILSPTFVLVRQYEIPHPSPLLKGEGDERRSSRQARTINLYHIDLYRIDEPQDIKKLGIEEFMSSENSVTIIEWADKLLDFKPGKGYKINFKHLGEDQREILIEKL